MSEHFHQACQHPYQICTECGSVTQPAKVTRYGWRALGMMRVDDMERHWQPKVERPFVDEADYLALQQANAALVARVAELEKTFLHYHQASDGQIDSCVCCGLDLRDAIHKRVKQ